MMCTYTERSISYVCIRAHIYLGTLIFVGTRELEKTDPLKLLFIYLFIYFYKYMLHLNINLSFEIYILIREKNSFTISL